MRSRAPELWFHALGAKVGGGVTYLRAVLPELARQLEARGIRLVLLVPDTLGDLPMPEWVEVRRLRLAARNPLTRLVFDQIVLPLWVSGRPGAVLFCSGSFSPLVPTAPTVALLRNAIYFDDAFLAEELWHRRALLLAQKWLIARGARRCEALVYPSQSMRDLVEASYPELVARGHVNPYGIGKAFLGAGPPPQERASNGGRASFLYVMTYTLQKNLGYLLRALAEARRRALPVRVLVTSDLTSGSPASFDADRAFIEKHDLLGSGYLVPVGSKYGDDLIETYRSADACLFVSKCESFGHPLVEAMALGKPVVCSDLPYARELCGPYALYVDPAREADLVDVWARWPEEAASLGPAPQEELAARFSWEAHVGRLVETLFGAERPDETAPEPDSGRPDVERCR
jgi:glycosyltransferase involved in cell wall biosynthesis